jgi:hypothetical protein
MEPLLLLHLSRNCGSPSRGHRLASTRVRSSSEFISVLMVPRLTRGSGLLVVKFRNPEKSIFTYLGITNTAQHGAGRGPCSPPP